jgi:peptidyl-prolyl cis-trans isomerase D
MLQSFSDRIRNSRWLGYLIVGLISIPFALWGIQSYVGGPSPNVAAEVNGEIIPVQQVQQMAAQQRQQLRERFGGNLPEGLGERVFLQQALSEAINREVLRQATAEAGFRVTDEILRQNIRQQEMFRRNGEFDPELYRGLLSRSGLTPQQYEADVRAGYAIQQLQRGVAASTFVLGGEAREAARMMSEERLLSVLVHPRAAAAAQIELDDTAVRAYYEDNKDRFQRPPQLRVDYLDLNMQDLMQQVEVTEEDLRAEYRGNESRYKGREERRAAHILLQVDSSAGKDAEDRNLEKARQLRERLQQGASFAQLAREYSDDPGSAEQGGDLGYVSRGGMVEAFEQALFSLEEEGSVSEPVRSPYGYHLVKLLDIRKGESRSFSEARDEIADDLRRRRAERLFYDRVEVLRNSTYEQPGSLQPAADAVGIPIRTSEWFSRQSGEGIASNAAVREAAFSTEVRSEGLNSDLVEISPRRVVALRASDERPAEARPYEEVRDRAREELREQRIGQALRRWVEESRNQLDQGVDPASLAREPVSLREPGWVQRGQEDTGVDPAVQEQAFSLPAPGEGRVHGAVTLSNGDRAVVILTESRLPEVDPETVNNVARQRQQMRSQGEVRAYLAALREAAEITRREDALTRP